MTRNDVRCIQVQNELNNSGQKITWMYSDEFGQL